MADRHIIDTLHRRAALHPDRPALLTHAPDRTITWAGYADLVKRFALGLAALGHQPGQPVAILGGNCPEWLISALGALAAGGVEVGVYSSNTPEQAAYVIGHSEAFACVVVGPEQLAKVRAQRKALPAMKWIVVVGEVGALQPGEIRYEEVLEKGALGSDGAYKERLEKIEPSTLAVLVYTSGTTGPPKGAMLSHENVSWTSKMLIDVINRYGTITDDERTLSYLPLAHIAEQLNSIFEPVQEGISIYFSRSLETLKEDLAWARPTVFFGVPRVWEKMKAGVEGKVRAAPAKRQALFAKAMAAGVARARSRIEGRFPGVGVALKAWIFEKLVFRKLRAALGLDAAKIVISGAAPIGRDVLEFFWAVGLPIMEIYGQTEVTGPTSFNTPDAVKIGSVGKALPGVEVKIAEDGEILVRGKNRFLGYYKDPEATRACLDGEWLRSGDVGEVDAAGFLRITDRKKDLIITAGGKNIAPQNLESLLKAVPLVSQAMVVGDRRAYLTALVALDPAAVQAWATPRGKPADLGALAGDAELRAELQTAIDGVNAGLAKYETIKKFAVVPAEFTIEGGELTPTMKLKRRVVNERYATLIESLYS